MAIIGMGTGSSVVPLPQATWGDRWAGLARLYASPAMPPAPDGLTDILEAARRREQETLRALQAAAAQRNAMAPPASGVPAKDFAVNLWDSVGEFLDDGPPLITPDRAGPAASPGFVPPANPLIYPTQIETPNGAVDPADPLGAFRPPAATPTPLGLDEGGISMDGTPTPQGAAPDPDAALRPPQDELVPTTAPSNFTLGDPRAGLGSVSVTPDSAERNSSQMDYLSREWVQEAGQTFLDQKASVQEQAYGTPVNAANPDKGPMGEDIFYYGADEQKYLGIDTEMQSYGYVATRVPTKPPKNATPEERYAYTQQMKEALSAPLYKVGSQYQMLSGLDRQQRIKLQKQMIAAGIYTDKDMIVPGLFTVNDIEKYAAVLGQANVWGYDVEKTLSILKIGHKDMLRRIEEARRAAGGGGGGGAVTQQTQINYTQTSIAQGRSLLASVLSDALGRAPSKAELAEFMARLNGQENKSPTKTITNYVRSGDSMTSTSRTDPTDVDPEQMARTFAAEINGGDEMFDYKANGYLDKLMQSLIGAQNV